MIMTNSKKVLLDIQCLRDGSKMIFEYKGKEYKIICWKSGDTLYYSVYLNEPHSLNGMNVDKISNKYISLYTYDMMKNKTKYKMSLEEIETGRIICAD